MKNKKISSYRLSRIITSRECKSSTDFLIDMYDAMTPEQRQEIKEMFIRNKNQKLCINA